MLATHVSPQIYCPAKSHGFKILEKAIFTEVIGRRFHSLWGEKRYP
jgi:hypothetical protein